MNLPEPNPDEVRAFGAGVPLGRPARPSLGSGARTASDPDGSEEPDRSDGSVREAPGRTRIRSVQVRVEEALGRLTSLPVDGDRPQGAAPVVALRSHPAEPPEDLEARAGAALEHGAPLLLLGDRYGTPAARRLVDRVQARVGTGRVELIEDTGLDALRAVAAEPGVRIDVVAPDAFASGLGQALVGIRDQAIRARRRASDAAGAGRSRSTEAAAWFGLGIIEQPPAPIQLHASLGRTLRLFEADDGIWLRGAAVEAPGLSTNEVEVASLQAAADLVFDAAFGEHVQGGHSLRAAGRVVVDDRLLSSFTRALLERLEDADEAASHLPPEWVREGSETSIALAAGRKIALDEGATLIGERRWPGRRPRDRAVFGLVVTNVERRMRLGGSIHPLGVLALMRASSLAVR